MTTVVKTNWCEIRMRDDLAALHEACPRCKGNTEVPGRMLYNDGAFHKIVEIVPCPLCKGKGVKLKESPHAD